MNYTRLKRYLMKKLRSGMIFNNTPINYLTWCAEACLAEVVPQTVKLVNTHPLPAAHSKDRTEITVWNYCLNTGKSVHYINIAGVDLCDITGNSFCEMKDYLFPHLHDTKVIVLDKASDSGALRFARQIISQGILVTDSRHSLTIQDELDTPEDRQQLEDAWSMIRTGYGLSSLDWGYAGSHSNIGVFQIGKRLTTH